MEKIVLSDLSNQRSVENAKARNEHLTRTCVDCGCDISERGWRAIRCKVCYKIYRRKRARELWHLHRESRLATDRKWRSLNKEKVKRKRAKDWEKHRKDRIAHAMQYYNLVIKPQMVEWGQVSDGSVAFKNGKYAEKIAPDILSLEGYADILYVNGVFPFDFLAKKDSVIHLIEVTSSFKKTLKDVQIKLSKYLGFPIVVLFVKPDGTKYRLSVNPKFRNSSVFSKFISEPFKNIADIGLSQIGEA